MEGQTEASPGSKLRVAIVAFRISEAIYIAISLCLPTLVLLAPEAREEFPLWGAFCTGFLGVGFAVFIEIVVRELKKQKFWAWIAGICLSGLYIPSIFFPLGVMGLIGLLDGEVRAAFGIGVTGDDAS